jgi:hypothetical protein
MKRRGSQRETPNAERPTSNAQCRDGIEQANLPAEGIEPTRSCDHWILSPARLPVPPRRRAEAKLQKGSRSSSASRYLDGETRASARPGRGLSRSGVKARPSRLELLQTAWGTENLS